MWKKFVFPDRKPTSDPGTDGSFLISGIIFFMSGRERISPPLNFEANATGFIFHVESLVAPRYSGTTIYPENTGEIIFGGTNHLLDLCGESGREDVDFLIKGCEEILVDRAFITVWLDGGSKKDLKGITDEIDHLAHGYGGERINPKENIFEVVPGCLAARLEYDFHF